MTTQVLTTGTPAALWLSVNPSFRRLEQPLLAILQGDRPLAHWGYDQTPDEPSSLAVAVTLLHDYVKGCDRPLHLIGHSTGGLVGLLYARQHPDRVKSLTLLGVGINPAIDWKAHYYTQLDLLPCGRRRVLTQMVHSLFGRQPKHCLEGLLALLERDLMTSLSLHSPLGRYSLFPGGVGVPLLVAGGQEDRVVDPVQLQGWKPWLKPGDRLWLCPAGRHFFYASHAAATAAIVQDFWAGIAATNNPLGAGVGLEGREAHG
ncbi:MAG TPA: alpha/beta hydrolase [Candidatus Obscuribacterales bacterium]